MNRSYRPNQIPPKERFTYLILSGILFIYALWSINTRQFTIPWFGRGARSTGSATLHGAPIWIMAGAFFCAIANFLSVILDHYDERNNERNYKLFGRITEILGWVLFCLAFLVASSI